MGRKFIRTRIPLSDDYAKLRHERFVASPIANLFHPPPHDSTPKAKAILVQADQVADEVGLDDEVVNGLVVGMGLE
jgi:hypothetical protein